MRAALGVKENEVKVLLWWATEDKVDTRWEPAGWKNTHAHANGTVPNC